MIERISGETVGVKGIWANNIFLFCPSTAPVKPPRKGRISQGRNKSIYELYPADRWLLYFDKINKSRRQRLDKASEA